MRVAVVGGGAMGLWHVREATRAGGLLVAIGDPDVTRARRLAGRRAGTRVFARMTDLLAECRPEVVHVCTPLETHVELATAALATRAHVLVEKPVAATTDETQHLLSLATSVDRLLCPVHQHLFQTPLADPGSLLARTGGPLSLAFTVCSAGADARPEDRDAIVAEILPHPLAVAERILPHGVAHLRWSAVRPRAGELRALADGGTASVSLSVSMAGRPPCNELRLVGERATAWIDFFHGCAFIEPGGVSRGRKIVRPFALAQRMVATSGVNLVRRTVRTELAYPGLRGLIVALLAYVRGAGPVPIAPAETLAVARARHAILAAAGLG